MQGGLDRLPRRARRAASKKKKITSISLMPTNQQMLATNPISDCADEDDEMVSIELLETGDRIEIRSGEIVPVDGIVIEGIGSLNRAPLTGESIPIRVTEGDEVHAGLVSIEDRLSLNLQPLELPLVCLVLSMKFARSGTALHVYKQPLKHSLSGGCLSFWLVRL